MAERETYRHCPKHPSTGYHPGYWRGCKRCHPVIVAEDVRDRLMSGVISPEQALYELLGDLIEPWHTWMASSQRRCAR